MLLLISDEQLFAWLLDRVQIETNTTITYSDDVYFSRGMTPELQLNSLNITENNQAYSAQITSLRVQIDLFELLKGRVDIPILDIGDVEVIINSSSESETENSGVLREILSDFSGLQIIPVIHQADFGKIMVEFEGDSWQPDVNQISELKLNINASQQIPVFTADVKVEQQQLHIDAFLPNFSQSLKNKKLPFSFKLDGRFATADFSGEIDLQTKEPSIKAFFNATIRDLSSITRNHSLELPGSIILKAKVAGDLSEPALNDILLTWDTLHSGHMSLTGDIANVIAGNQIDLNLSGKFSQSQWLQKYLPESLPIHTAEVNTRISGSFERLILHELDFSAKTGVKKEEQLNLGISGGAHLVKSSDALYELENINALFNFNAPTSKAARPILFEKLPEYGPIKGSATIKSISGPPKIENISLLATHPDGINITVSGDIHTFPLDDQPIQGFALAVDIKAAETALITQSVDLDLPLKGPITISFSISGDTSALLFHNIALEAGQKEALIIKANGLLQFGNWAKDDPLETIEMTVQMNSHTTASFAQLIHSTTLPEFGPLALKANIKTTNGQHAVSQFHLKTVKSKTDKNNAVSIDITGGASSLSFLPDLSVDGIHLKAQAKGKDITRLTQLFGIDSKSVPALGSFALSSDLSGSHKQLLVNNTKIVIGKKKNLQITGNGQIGKLAAQSDWKLYDTDLSVKVIAENIQQGLKSFNQQIPDLGPLKGSARIQSDQDKFKLHSLNLKIGKTKSPLAVARGTIQDLLKTKGVDIKIDLNIDEKNLGHQIKQSVLRDIKPLTGYVKISDPKDVLGIQSLKLRSVQKDLNVVITGRFPDFKQPKSMTLKTTVDASNLALLGDLFGYSWQTLSWSKREPLKFTSEIGSDGKVTRIKFLLNVANKSMETELTADFAPIRPKISGRVKVKEMTFSEFYQIVKGRDKEVTQTKLAKTKDKQKNFIFSRKSIDFDGLKQFDLDLALDIQSFESDVNTAESAKLQLKLEAGHLKISPAEFKFAKGHLNMDLSLNTKVKPEINFKAFGKNIDPWLGIDDSQVKDHFIADVDVDIELHAQGKSLHELVSSMNGELYVTIENGKIRHEYMDLLFIDLIGWTARKATDSKFYDLNCGV
ncbi:MAG: AsmA family protein, partial [Thiotrichaceae bacterium]|nr:AsmA family protein [Thiotrichaceae bacterium]